MATDTKALIEEAETATAQLRSALRHHPHTFSHAITPSDREEPDPHPWVVTRILASLAALEIASKVTDEQAARRLRASAEAALQADIDDICPPFRHWPWPGPPPWVIQALNELVAVANSSEFASNREAIVNVAAKIAERNFAQ